jgi:hypothetical protein
MFEQPYILLIMNCKKYQKKAVFQKMTWLKKIPETLKYYHVIGEEELEKEYEFDDENHVLKLKVADDYNSLPKKVIQAYEAVSKTFRFQYIMKTDDDQILVKPSFFETMINRILNMTPKIHYGGYNVDVKPHLSQYHRIHPELPPNLPLYATKYCSGRFYFLSKEAVEDLLSKKDAIRNEYFEDYAIGFYMDSKLKTNILNIATNTIFTDIELSDFSKWVQEKRL